jgi:hypothetical protein
MEYIIDALETVGVAIAVLGGEQVNAVVTGIIEMSPSRSRVSFTSPRKIEVPVPATAYSPHEGDAPF